MSVVVPAVLPTSRKDLREKLELFAALPEISCVQIDLVDGQFASPVSWPYSAPEELKEWTTQGEFLPHLHQFDYEIDLMGFDAEDAAEAWVPLGVSRVLLHIEALFDPTRTLARLQGRHSQPVVSYGLALNIATDLLRIEPYLDRIDYVQFMGIATIGKQAQPFDKRVLGKIRAFRARYPNIPIQVDGGVSLETAPQLLALGVDRLVSGSSILRADDPAAAVKALESISE